MDVEALLQPRDSESPSGDDLEYDPLFTDLEIAAQPGEERVMGDQVIEAEDPDWPEVRRLALDILERSHDLRAAVYLANAELRVNGFEGFARSLSYMRGAIEQHWDTVHPQLDPDDDNDPTMRVNAIVGLTDGQGALKGVRLAPLTDSRGFGRWGMRHLQVATGELAPPPDMENPPDSATVSAAFQDTAEDRLTEIAEAVGACLDNARGLEAALNERIPGQAPDLDALIDVLRGAKQQLGQYVSVGGGDEPNDTPKDDSPDTGGGGQARSGGAAIGGISGPADVTRALERLIEYYERFEPSSPVPLLLQRAKRLVSADFMTIMQDMAPDALENARVVIGVKDEEENSW